MMLLLLFAGLTHVLTLFFFTVVLECFTSVNVDKV